MKINRIPLGRHPYLVPLVNIHKPPEVIFARGTLPAERRPSVAIVGSRKPTAYGREVTAKIAGELASKGIVVISGLAFGIDAIAHQAALETGGTTIAVLASSVDQITPKSHKGLGEQIIDHDGAIISEYEPPAELTSWNLLARNRLVSGLADALIVIEAANRSGTLSTASHALSQGKPIFAVPGNITSPLSAGCNNLIKQGAFPLTEASDVIDVIAPQLNKPQATLALGSTPLETELIKLLQSGVRDGDDLQQQSGADASNFNQALTMMEINGLVTALGANQWTLK